MKSLIPRFSPFWGFFLARQIDRVANSGGHDGISLFVDPFHLNLQHPMVAI